MEQQIIMETLSQNKQIIIRKLLHFGTVPLWIVLTSSNINNICVVISLIILSIAINSALIYYSYKTKRFGPINFGLIFTIAGWYTVCSSSYYIELTYAIGILAIADGASTFIPTLIGTNKLHKICSKINNKTILGSFIFFIISSIILFDYLWSIPLAIIFALLLTIVEYFCDNPIIKFDDNLNIFLFTLLIFIIRGI